jgi:hypothetical protein
VESESENRTQRNRIEPRDRVAPNSRMLNAISRQQNSRYDCYQQHSDRELLQAIDSEEPQQ